MPTEATICLIRRGGYLLLQQKAPGRFGAGRWNAPGGKLRPGESPADCTVREVLEETGLQVLDPRPHGVFAEFFGPGDEPVWLVHVFASSLFSGELRPNSEGGLRWFPEQELPYAQMWRSDGLWLPHVLRGGEFEATFRFDPAGTILLQHDVVLK